MVKGALSRLAKMGGRDMALELLDRFLIEGPQRLEQAKAALGAQDGHNLQHHLHRICSDAGWLGAVDVQELAGRGEMLAEKGQFADLDVLLEQLSEKCFQVCMKLEQEKIRLLDPEYRPSREILPNESKSS